MTNGHTLSNGTSTDGSPSTESAFPPISSYQYRNLVTADSYIRGPPVSGLGLPGPGVNEVDVEPLGLNDVAEDILKELPDECLVAFLAAREQEKKWKNSWASEKEDGARATPRITYSQV